jgi:dipeptidyl aminopeptidase/acylaminoacyl peptidase
MRAIPCDVLFNHPEYTNVSLSRDGKYVFYIKSSDKEKKLYKLNLQECKEEFVNSYNNGVKIYGQISEGVMYFLSDNNNDMMLSNLTIDDNGIKKVISFKDGNIKILSSFNIIKDKLVFASNHEKHSLYDLYELDIATMTYEKIYENSENSFKWVISDKNKIVGKYLYTEENNEIHLLFLINGNWVLLRHYKLTDYWRNRILYYSEDVVVIVERGENDTFSVIEIDIKNDFRQKTLYKYQYDISSVISFDKTIYAVGYAANRLEWEIATTNYYHDFKKMLDKKYGDLQSIEYNEHRDTFLLAYTKDIVPKSYYIYDKKNNTMKYLFKSRTTLDNYTLSKTEGVVFESTNNIKIHGYLTKSNDFDKRTLIVKIHGGPTQRDYWGYDSFVQFFASRGYYVLEINYRGSFGFGAAFENLLNKEMGGGVTEDIAVAIAYFLSIYPDTRNIFFFGWSSGGYIALMTSINFYIEKLRGIIAISAALMLEDIINNSDNTGIQKKEAVVNIFGDPEKDALDKQSIIKNARRIRNPVFYAYGRCDKGMNIEHINEFRNLVPSVKICSFENEGHGINNPKNRIYLFNEIESFLKENIKC